MSPSLVEALGQADLEAGRTYRFHINDKWVELRVLDPSEAALVPHNIESDTMLDPWVEFPRPTSGVRLRVRPGSLPLPDVPEIPTDDSSL
jgi:hypothetical protein